MPDNSILTSIDRRGVARVTLDRPDKHNAFDDRMIVELTGAFQSVANNPSARIMILAANGKSFSAGADLDWMQRTASYTYAENLRDAQALAQMLKTLNQMPVPTIARVQGAAFGGATGLVSCCDMAVGTHRASFSLSEVKIGLVPATISPYVIAAIGQRASRRYFQTAERFNAQTAENLQLLSLSVDESELDPAVDALCTTLLANGPEAVKAAKQLVFDVENQPLLSDELIQKTSELIASIRVSEEGREGLAAFLEKRPARWMGQEPSAGTDKEPSAYREPSARADKEPSAYREPSAGTDKEPSAYREPSAGTDKEPSAYREPSARADKEPSAYREPSARADKEPSAYRER